MVTESKQRVHKTDKTSDNYKGIPAHAAAGLHDEIFREVCQRFSASRGPILELAAGSGALTQRLLDHGFDVHPVDLSADTWRVPDVAPEIADFNRPGWTGTLKRPRYAQIVAAEVIEHLDNPRGFMRDIHALLEPGGTAIVTTPNPLSAMSTALSLVDSRYYVFDRKYYYDAGHVSMLPPWMLRCHAEEAGLGVEKLVTVCEPRFDSAVKTAVYGAWRIIFSTVRRQRELGKQISLMVVTRR